MSRLIARRSGLPTILPYSTSLPVGNMPNWTQTYAEDFDTDIPVGGFIFQSGGQLTPASGAYNAYYHSISGAQDGSVASNNNGDYRPSQTLSISNSVLTCTQQVFTTGKGSGALYHPLESTPGTTPQNEPWAKGPYRRLTYRARCNATGPGFGFVGLFISNPWPQGGELDWMEGDCYNPTIEGWHHYAQASGISPSQQQIGPVAGKSRHDFHVYDIQWMPDRVIYSCDGVIILNTTTLVGSATQKITFQGAQSGGTPPANGTTATWEIDWVAIYDYVQ
jgi:beta-glucanase (GH16 family)